MTVEHKLIYDIVKGLKHRKPKIVKHTSPEDMYKKYYIAACRLRVIKDDRYPAYAGLYQFMRSFEFPDQQWHLTRGSRQALSYRCNRIEENLKTILRKSINTSGVFHLYRVYASRSWENLGYVKARSASESEQLADMLYGSLSEHGTRTEFTQIPIWSGEDDGVFTHAMNKQLQHFQKVVDDCQRQIEDLQQKIEKYNNSIDFLTLNMVAFENG